MGAPRRKNIIASRRRVEDEGEEEEGSLVTGVEDDSLSEASIISDADDDADAEASDASDVESMEPSNPGIENTVNGHSEESAPMPLVAKTLKKASLGTVTHDTEAMMNGLKFTGDADEEEGIHFDDIGKEHQDNTLKNITSTDSIGVVPIENPGEKRRREHEEYKKKQNADPAFVPNRGEFFMHDHRSAAPGQNGFRPFGRGRTRGRGGMEGSSTTARHVTQTLGPVDAKWDHDLHETVVQSDASSNGLQVIPSHPSMPEYSKPTVMPSKTQPPNRSFSKTTRIGNIQIRVFMAGMSSPITFSAVPVNQHTRLPHHRPPLRRDKPVRVSLPDMPIQYIFPSTERSFIFIPRALRPNQQGFGRARGRGSFGGYSGFGGFSSRRTSAYAGSTYSPSVAMSRRSSLAREVSTEGIVSPGATSATRLTGVTAEPGKPRVRLPPAIEQIQFSGQEAPSGRNLPPIINSPKDTYPLPQKPTFRENRPAPIPMHQPRPQKTVSVADIESPATMDFNPPPQQQQQPFHQQVPAQVVGQMYVPELSALPHSRHASYPSQASGGTPLSQIPERALQAQPFQPYPYQQPQPFYPPQYPQPIYFYPPTEQLPSGPPSITAPPFVPGQQYPYAIPFAAGPPLSMTEPTTQSGTVAHESNGMVYYYDSTQLATNGENNPGYAQPIYPMSQNGGVIGIGGMMTPPVQYFPQPSPAGYYPTQ